MKIYKNGFEFICYSTNEVKEVLKAFGKNEIEAIKAPAKEKSIALKQKQFIVHNVWTEEEVEIIVKAILNGEPFSTIKRNGALSRHSIASIYNRYHLIITKSTKKAGVLTAKIMARYGML